MPNLEEHCKHSLRLYGVEGREVHSWMDDPCRKFAGSHRQFRHDTETIEFVKEYFAEKIGPKLAGNIAIDHIMLDHEETVKKRREKNDAILSDKDPYELEKPKYEKKKEELRRELRLSEIKTSRIKDYIQITYAHRKEDLFDLAVTSLLDWENYCLSRENPNSNIEIKDITGYVNNLFNRAKPVNSRTAAHYLGFLVAYLKHDNREDLANYANNEKKKCVKKFREADKNAKSMPIKDVVELYKSAPLRGKILIRLLLLQTLIPIQSLETISFIQTSEGKYQFNIDGNIINSIDEETIKLAEPLIKENILKGDRRLLDIAARTFEANIHNYAESVHLSYKVTPKDLRKFGRNHHPDDLMEMLSNAPMQYKRL